MKYEMKRWFGDSIMIYTIDNFESINKTIKELIVEDIDPSGRLEIFPDKDNWTPTRLTKTNTLYKDKNFEELFEEIEVAIKIFLREHHYNLDVLDVYITKAWASLTKKGEFIAEHNHTASHYSVVYYVEAENQGNINFKKLESPGLFIPGSTECYTEHNEHNIESITYSARTGDLIIFPSNMMHGTEINQQESSRVSVALDFLLTMKKGQVSEHNLSSPETWKKIV